MYVEGIGHLLFPCGLHVAVMWPSGVWLSKNVRNGVYIIHYR